MTLPLDVQRCQGRIARGIGGPTLCAECTDCQRRTDVPADGEFTWMPPPVKKWESIECFGYIGPGDEVVE